MPVASAAVLRPRKTPVQARSGITVQAIQEATLQVLLRLGPDRLTTVRVAQRAGVSVGTLYQYFPNKEALLYSLIDSKMEHVTAATESACTASHGLPTDTMAEALVNAFVDAKLAHREASVALYPLTSRLQLEPLISRHSHRMERTLAAMLLSVPGCSAAQAAAVAQTFPGVLSGTMRSVVEAGAPDEAVARIRIQLVVLAKAYFSAALAGPVDASVHAVK